MCFCGIILQLSGIKIGTGRLTRASTISRWFTINIKDRFLIISHYSIMKWTNRIFQRHHRTHFETSNSDFRWVGKKSEECGGCVKVLYLKPFRFFSFFLATSNRASTWSRIGCCGLNSVDIHFASLNVNFIQLLSVKCSGEILMDNPNGRTLDTHYNLLMVQLRFRKGFGHDEAIQLFVYDCHKIFIFLLKLLSDQ